MTAPEVTQDVLQNTAAKIGVHIPQEHEAEYTELLSMAKKDMETVMAMDGMALYHQGYSTQFPKLYSVCPDYMPISDRARFPRTGMATVAKSDNPFNAWAVKVTVQNVNESEREEGLLHGQRVVLKVNIASMNTIIRLNPYCPMFRIMSASLMFHAVGVQMSLLAGSP